MERYNNLRIGIKSSVPNIAQANNAPLKFSHKRRKTNNKSNERSVNNSQLNTIDASELYDNSVKVQQNSQHCQKGTPGVGEYEISTSIIKPSYQTYQKSDQVILVKINHVGGTSSFRSEGERFNSSIYQHSLSPGPGTYQMYTAGKQQHYNNSYHQNYELIQELLRSSREKMQSIPNYNIGVPRPGMEYNGMPRHLQQMYINLNKKKQQSGIVKSLPLQKLIKLRKRTQKLPMMKNQEQRIQYASERSGGSDKMTQTLYRLDQQIRRQNKRFEKIRAILKTPHRNKSKTIDNHSIQSLSVRKKQQSIVNKNMVNIMFEKLK